MPVVGVPAGRPHQVAHADHVKGVQAVGRQRQAAAGAVGLRGVRLVNHGVDAGLLQRHRGHWPSDTAADYKSSTDHFSHLPADDLVGPGRYGLMVALQLDARQLVLLMLVLELILES